MVQKILRTETREDITPARVKMAYEMTGMTPQTVGFGNNKRGCALSALYVAETGNQFNGPEQILDWAMRKFGPTFHWDFTEGFDEYCYSEKDWSSDSPDFHLGRACAAAVFGEEKE